MKSCICITLSLLYLYLDYLEFAVFVGEEHHNWQAANDNALKDQAM